MTKLINLRQICLFGNKYCYCLVDILSVLWNVFLLCSNPLLISPGGISPSVHFLQDQKQDLGTNW